MRRWESELELRKGFNEGKTNKAGEVKTGTGTTTLMTELKLNVRHGLKYTELNELTRNR